MERVNIEGAKWWGGIGHKNSTICRNRKGGMRSPYLYGFGFRGFVRYAGGGYTRWFAAVIPGNRFRVHPPPVMAIDSR